MYPYTTEGLRIKLQNTTTGDESNNEYSEHGLGLFLTTTSASFIAQLKHKKLSDNDTSL